MGKIHLDQNVELGTLLSLCSSDGVHEDVGANFNANIKDSNGICFIYLFFLWTTRCTVMQVRTFTVLPTVLQFIQIKVNIAY